MRTAKEHFTRIVEGSGTSALAGRAYHTFFEVIVLDKDFATANELFRMIHDDESLPINVAVFALMIGCETTAPMENRDMLYQRTIDRLVASHDVKDASHLLKVLTAPMTLLLPKVEDVKAWLKHIGYKPCDEGWWKLDAHPWSLNRDSCWVLVPDEITEGWLSREARFFKKTVEELCSEIHEVRGAT